MATSSTDFDAIVIGGGPAGLQATLTLARVHRRVLMLDSGTYRNDPAHHMHNVVTHDGRPPADFRRAARFDLERYDTVTIRDDAATEVRQDGDDFVVTTGQGTATARGLVLATGVRDSLPDKPGLEALFGGPVAHCPFCHGHEFAGRQVAILGAQAAGHLPGILRPVVAGITVLTDGAVLDSPLPSDVRVRTESVTGVCASPSGARVSFGSGPDEEFGGLYVTTTFTQSAPFAGQLGLRTLDSGCVEVDVLGRTSLPGVHAAGDMAHHRDLGMPMASVMTAAAAGQVAAASLVGLRLTD